MVKKIIFHNYIIVKHYFGRIMGRFRMFAALILACWLVAPAPAPAQPGLVLMDASDPDQPTVRIDLDAMIPHARRFTTLDPNFKEDGPTRFTGIPLKTLTGMAGLNVDNGITVIGSDQYVGFLSEERIRGDRGILAWQMNDAGIPKVKGGPLKLIFPEDAGVFPACLTWYADTIVAGSFAFPTLKVTRNGETMRYPYRQLIDISRPLPRQLNSIPQGCRKEFTLNSSGKRFSAVPLDYFTADTPSDQVVLRPYSGKDIVLKGAVLSYPAFLVTGCDGSPLHPAFGGPFALVFPVEAHPELADLVPESGAAFFLEEIRF